MEYTHSLDYTFGTHKKVKFECPSCHHKKRFSRYIFTQTLEYLPSEFGKCDRENSCGYFLRPGHETQSFSSDITTPIPKFIRKYIPDELVKSSLSKYDENNLFLHVDKWTKGKAHELFDYFQVGTTKEGHATFWLINKKGVCQPKVVAYNEDGHRNKERLPFVPMGYSRDSGFAPCLFGEQHLTDKTVILVESEKSAMAGHFKMPDYTWIASGGSNGLTKDKAEVLKGHKVIVNMDDDQAGRKGTVRAMKMLRSLDVHCTSITPFPDSDKDIADTLEEIEESSVFEELQKKYPTTRHLNYYPELDREGYYDKLLLKIFRN